MNYLAFVTPCALTPAVVSSPVTMLCGLFLYLALAYAAYRWYNFKQVKPVFGVYNQKSKWYPFKYALFITIMHVRIFIGKYFVKEVEEREVAERQLDGPQPLIDHIKAFDAVFFIGANKDGFYFAMGAERRQSGVINGLFYLVVPGKGLLCSPKLPDTVLLGAKESQYGAEGLLMSPVEPMKKWKLRYKGQMWLQSDPSQTFSVIFNADWSSKFHHFNYDTDLHPRVVARAIAKETWTKEYFDAMKSAHQSRYEQMGEALVKLDLGGQRVEWATQSFRDHGYGAKRDWSLMHRYAFFHMFLDSGAMAAVGVVSQPCTVSSMETGYLYEADGTIQPVEWCDFQLYQHGEGGTPPKDHGFQFKAGGVVYRVQVTVVHENTHFVGWDWEARMVERFVRYSVNGVSGQGVSEFQYRHRQGRPAAVNTEDPSWFQALRQQYIYS